jgi:hypothetical protein
LRSEGFSLNFVKRKNMAFGNETVSNLLYGLLIAFREVMANERV